MNWLQKLILGKENVQQLKAFAGGYQPGVKYQIDRGKIITPLDNTTTYIRDGYSINEIVYSVTNIILDKVRLPEWGLYKVVKESSLKEYQRLIRRKDLSGKDYKRALKLKADSLEPLDTFDLQSGKLRDLLIYPNEQSAFQDFVAETILFKLLTGNAYIWGERLGSGANAGIPNSLNILPSQFVQIEIDNGFPISPVGYKLYNWGKEFVPEDILHNKYANPNWDINGLQLYGMSPLKAGLKNICRNNSAKDSSTAKFQNGGLEGIIYMDDPRFTPDQGEQQMKALKIQQAHEYSGPTNQGKLSISGYKTGFIPLGLSPVDLGIIESEKWDAIMFCNIYGVPADMLVPEHRTFNNAKEAEKALTTRSAMPLLVSLRNDLNRKLQSDWGAPKGIVADFDVECFTELQSDISEVVNTTSKMMMVTPNEEREAMGWETRPEPEADQVWVIQNGSRVPLSDFQPNPVDNVLNGLMNGNGSTSGNQTNGVPKVSQNGAGKKLSH